MPTHAIPDDIASELIALQQESPLLVFLFDADDRGALATLRSGNVLR